MIDNPTARQFNSINWKRLCVVAKFCAFVLGAFVCASRLAAEDGSPIGFVLTQNPFLAPGQEDQGWPFLRGLNYDGRSEETSLADEWPANGPPVLWTRELGQGYSGFVAWQDRVATQYQNLAGQFVACLRADTGDVIWQHRYDWPYEPAGVYPGPRATPTYYQGRVYFAAPNFVVGCLDAESGKPLWSVNTKERFDGAGTDFGYACSPTVVADKVLLPIGGRGASLVALSAADGSLVWKSGDDAASYTPAYPIQFRGRWLILGYLQNALVCHELENGKRVWRRELSAGYDEHSAWPIYREPYLWLSGPFQAGSELLELTGDPDRPLRIVWKSKLLSNDVASSVLVEGAIYGFDLREVQVKTHRPSRGRFRCLDFVTGKERWAIGDEKARRTLEDAGDAVQTVGHATVIAADGKLFLLNDTGELILARATPERYEELSRVTVLGGEIGWTPPTLHRGRLFLRNHSRAVCVYVGRPELLSPEIREASVAASDVPQSPYVDWAAIILGVEPEYAFDIPSNRWLAEWFAVSLVILLASGLVGVFAWLLLKERLGTSGSHWLFWTLAFVLGALGTTVLSSWRGDFVFTWPVALFVAFQAVVSELRLKKLSPADCAPAWRSWLAALLFILSCAAYFLVCRRLSLVFEWTFLCGFGAALPPVLAGAFLFRGSKWRLAWEGSLTFVGFAAFYGFAVVVLWWKG